MFRRKSQLVRRPAPDPRVEAELQRIISLRLLVTQWERNAETAGAEAAKAMQQSTRVSHHGKAACASYAARGKEHRETMRAAQARVIELHEEIAKRLTGLTDDDLLWLEPARPGRREV